MCQPLLPPVDCHTADTLDDVQNQENAECVPLLEEIVERDEDPDGEARAESCDLIRIINPDGTIFEMEDNIVLPDTCQDDSDDELIEIGTNGENNEEHDEEILCLNVSSQSHLLYPQKSNTDACL